MAEISVSLPDELKAKLDYIFRTKQGLNNFVLRLLEAHFKPEAASAPVPTKEVPLAPPKTTPAEMRRFMAHCIMRVKYSEPPPPGTCISLWENIVYIESESVGEGWQNAELIGLESEDRSGEYTSNERSAELIFVGVRKFIEIYEPVADGVELTYLRFEVDTEDELRTLMDQMPLKITLADD